MAYIPNEHGAQELKDKLEQLPDSPQPVGMLAVDFDKIAEKSGLERSDLLDHLVHNEIYQLEEVEEEYASKKKLSCDKLGEAGDKSNCFLRMNLDDFPEEEDKCGGKVISIPYHCKQTQCHEGSVSKSGLLAGSMPSFSNMFKGQQSASEEKESLLSKTYSDYGNVSSGKHGKNRSDLSKMLDDAVPTALLKRTKGSHEDIYLMSNEDISHSDNAYLIPIPQKDEIPEHSQISSDLMMVLPEDKREMKKRGSLADKLFPKALETAEVFIEEKNNSANIVLKMNYHQHILGYAMLTFCMLANASQGSVTVGLKDTVASIRVACWRMQCLWVLMAPLFALELKRCWGDVRVIVTKPKIVITFLIASLAYFVGLSSFYLALHYTSMPHAFLLSNMHCLILVLYKWVSGQNTNFGEFTGTLIAVTGMFVTMIGTLKSGDSSSDTSVFDGLWGDMIALLGSFAAATFIVKGKQVRDKVPLYVYLWPLMLATNVGLILLSINSEGSDLSFTDNGVFGWMTSERILVGLYLGGVTGLMGTAGYIVCMKFVPGVSISVFMMLEPLAGSIMGVILGVTAMPDLYTLVGGTILIGGAILVILYTRDSSEEIDVTEYVGEVDPESYPYQRPTEKDGLLRDGCQA